MISVIIGNYNCGRFLEEAIKSVLEQGVADLEVIVVDDGSSDDSKSRVGPFLPRVRWLGLSHGGQGPALNAALAQCSGEFIAFLESDDVWFSDKLKQCLSCLQRDLNLVAVQHYMQQADAELKPLPTRFPIQLPLWNLKDFLEGRVALTGLSALVVRRDAFLRLLPLPDDLTTCVDEYIQPRLLAQGPIQHLSHPLGLRRIHDLNFYASMRDDPQRLKKYLDLRTILDRHLGSFLNFRNLRLSKEAEHQRRTQCLELDFFLYRERGSYRKAIKAWAELIGLYGFRPHAVFKGVSLGIAFCSPRLYRDLHNLYENHPWLPRLRERLFP